MPLYHEIVNETITHYGNICMRLENGLDIYNHDFKLILIGDASLDKKQTKTDLSIAKDMILTINNFYKNPDECNIHDGSGAIGDRDGFSDEFSLTIWSEEFYPHHCCLSAFGGCFKYNFKISNDELLLLKQYLLGFVEIATKNLNIEESKNKSG